MEQEQRSGHIIDITKIHIKRRRIVLKAILLGLIVGLISCAFRFCLGFLEWGRTVLFQRLTENGVDSTGRLLIALAIGVLGVSFALWLVRRFSPDASGSGIPQLKSVVLGDQTFRWQRLLPVKFFAGLLGIGSGLALGREGPTIQMGGAAGMMLSDGLRLKAGSAERTVLVSAGSAAGLSAAFNAPLAALMFVLEELYGTLTPIIFVASFLAAVAADVVGQLLLGGRPVFALDTIAPPSLHAIPFALLLGVLCGLLGVAFNRVLLGIIPLFERIKRCSPLLPGIITGTCLGVALWFDPEIVGSGTRLTEHVLGNDMPRRILLILLLSRFALTMLSYGSGAAGGIFTPILVLGALSGLMVGRTAHLFLPDWSDAPVIFAVIGMGALFTAIVRAPLTGIVLMIELTGEYGFMLPLLVASLTAYGIAEYLRVPPIYEALRKRTARGP